MTEPIQTKEPPQRNLQAIASLILGIIAVLFAAFNFASGLLSALGCVGPAAALLSFVAGIRALRMSPTPADQGRRFASLGMFLGGIGLIAFVAIFLPNLINPTKILDEAITSATAQAAAGEKPSATILPTEEETPIPTAQRTEAIPRATPQPTEQPGGSLVTFQGDAFSLTYPSDWIEMPMDEIDFCQQLGVECLLMIGHPSRDTSNLNLIRLRLTQEGTVEEVEAMIWADLAQDPEFTVISREEITVGVHKAIMRIFTAPANNVPNGYSHNMQIYIVEGTTFYEFTGWMPKEALFLQHREEFMEIITSFRITP